MKDKDEGGMTLDSGSGSARLLLGGRREYRRLDQISVPAEMVGRGGRSWRCDLDEGRRVIGVPREKDGVLVNWVVEAPWAHPVWHSYSILLLHLRPIEGLPPAILHREDATHELLVHALNPDHPREELIKTGVLIHFMTPINFGAQFVELSDELALDRVERTVREIVDGHLSPDTDYQLEWRRRFGSDMIKKEYR